MRNMQRPLNNNMITITQKTAFLNLTPHISIISPKSEEGFLGLDFCSGRGGGACEVVPEGRTYSDRSVLFGFGAGPEGGEGEGAGKEGLANRYETVDVGEEVGDEEEH